MLVFLYVFAWLVVDSVLNAPTFGARYLIYLSNLSYILLCLSFMVSMVGVLVYSIQRCCCKRCTKIEPAYATTPAEFYRQDNTPWFLKLAWLINTIAVPASAVTTIAFWALLYQPGGILFTANLVHVHGVGLFLVLVDLFISRAPMMLFHVIYPTVYGAAYVIFMGIYFAAQGTNPLDGEQYVYSIFDYGRQPLIATGYSFALVVAMAVSFLVFFIVTLLRDQVVKRCKPCFWNVVHPDDDTSSIYYQPTATTV